MKQKLKRVPIIGSVLRFVYFKLVAPFRRFPGSGNYWRERYQAGGNSGEGSYSQFAEFKAEVLNDWVKSFNVASVIELGCGDGNQLALCNFATYLGVDISPEAVEKCRSYYRDDRSKSFMLADDYLGQTAEMALSLDVVYHLVEDAVFDDYMRRLFASATRFVAIYSSDTDVQFRVQGKHVRHRKFSAWIETNASGWQLVESVPNRYPYVEKSESGSFADFYLYGKKGQ